MDELKLLSKLLDIENLVHFEGFCEDVHEKIKNAEIFAFSSDYEGMPNALMEAMMMGLPCISTNCSGMSEIITHEINGLLVPVGDISALVRALCRVCDDRALRKK